MPRDAILEETGRLDSSGLVTIGAVRSERSRSLMTLHDSRRSYGGHEFIAARVVFPIDEPDLTSSRPRSSSRRGVVVRDRPSCGLVLVQEDMVKVGFMKPTASSPRPAGSSVYDAHSRATVVGASCSRSSLVRPVIG